MPRISSRPIIIFAVIAAVASSLAITSNAYYTYSANEIFNIASNEVRSNSEIQAHDLANVLVNKMESVKNNLQVISKGVSVQTHDVQSAMQIFTAAKQSTGNFSSSYFWVNRDGKLVWADAFTNKTLEQQYNGGDRSNRDYFIVPKNTLQPYYSTVIDSVDGVSRVYVSYPIIQNNQSGSAAFDGVIVSAINVDTLGHFLQSQLSPKLAGTTGMIDKNGIILYSANETLIGKDIFGNEVQASLPAQLKDPFNTFVHESLKGNPGSGDFSYLGNTSTIAYQPVVIEGNTFAILYVIAPHLVASNVDTLISEQRNFNNAIIASIAAVAVGIAIVVLLWNRRLGGIVESKTMELRKSNESLAESNKQLATANEMLGVNEKMQREFINIAAHELRTPTQAILGYSELFDIRDEGKEEIIKAISRNATRLERLTNDILDVTRIEGNTLTLNKEKFNLNEVVLAAIDDAKSQTSNGDINFVYVPPTGPIIVQADKARIMQVISNLLSNAIKFTKHGTVTINLKQSDGIASVSVVDSGTGIHPDMQGRLFTKFASKSQTGTGLGLYISKNIIEAHGGQISGENNQGQSGANFSFTLPLK